MPADIPGIHHVTAIAGDPQQNLDFYTNVLGLRLVKKTVNHDTITTYHLFYGDKTGRPGFDLTFFPWPNGRDGPHGTGQAETVSFLIPDGSLDYWRNRLDDHDITYEQTERFDESVLTFQDPDGLDLELVERSDAPGINYWEDSPVPEEHAIRGFHGVTLILEAYEQTAELLEEMGFAQQDSEGNRHRHRSSGDVGFIVDVVSAPNRPRGGGGVGTIHHVAFRTENKETQRDWRQHLLDQGFNVTNVIDRWYFHSIYFHEPGGVLFEIATEGPGFTKDQDVEELGTELMLPAWLEEKRGMIANNLPELERSETDE